MSVDYQSDPPDSSKLYHLMVGAIAGVFSFAALSLALSRIEVDPIGAAIFASLSALTVGVFVYRERVLVDELALAERKHTVRLQLEADRINELYVNSVACLVTFDAGSLVIDRVSSGFLDLLGISASQDLAGACLGEVLGVDSTHLSSVVHQIKAGTISVREEMECQLVDGKSVKILVSGHYMPDLYLVEAALFRLPRKTTELANYERLMDDLERFKKGIVRREGRVLELKGEVNQLLDQGGQPKRYQVDSMSNDSQFSQLTLKAKKAVEHG